MSSYGSTECACSEQFEWFSDLFIEINKNQTDQSWKGRVSRRPAGLAPKSLGSRCTLERSI